MYKVQSRFMSSACSVFCCCSLLACTLLALPAVAPINVAAEERAVTAVSATPSDTPYMIAREQKLGEIELGTHFHKMKIHLRVKVKSK